ncbi:26S proteasome non-ATPase regulatory subunit, putative [Trichomonas vaginalis G3]|uniref:26S proteasome non-ATPase regulatory subunit, putative n=1 Tax=Trichomonas vaginalis (strain ATCC PRA-98 / G3) TaxID=412133 RepID=A2E0P1_TRIV3|nr:26S proteasome non-ATPase regulatory subunit family [Trichomonas vaginalis G3]EAY13786.1 26S proteasome non-ATPase regulatory subunit, putative [Trichomonas vaginalis G3]KAI5542698.1 26S proteasome non-ATPase regulatory subunit family [Trichomonas vaginalis G3]|eukprot:XP_001326009.1 26S proteasome non-ATPase regulatory subunit [Trichomonas vaginalis G3]
MSLQQKSVKAASFARDIIDKQLEDIKAYLESTGVGYRGSLVDKDGFPLPNIDHFRIANERKRAARLLNDRKRIENLISELLVSVPTGDKPTLMMELEKQEPFCLISEVREGSPAEKAGLIDGDLLIKFGPATNMLDVKKNIVEGTAVDLVVYRVEEYSRELASCSLTPAKWEGDGLVGCHLIPL